MPRFTRRVEPCVPRVQPRCICANGCIPSHAPGEHKVRPVQLVRGLFKWQMSTFYDIISFIASIQLN